MELEAARKVFAQYKQSPGVDKDPEFRSFVQHLIDTESLPMYVSFHMTFAVGRTMVNQWGNDLMRFWTQREEETHQGIEKNALLTEFKGVFPSTGFKKGDSFAFNWDPTVEDKPTFFEWKGEAMRHTFKDHAFGWGMFTDLMNDSEKIVFDYLALLWEKDLPKPMPPPP